MNTLVGRRVGARRMDCHLLHRGRGLGRLDNLGGWEGRFGELRVFGDFGGRVSCGAGDLLFEGFLLAGDDGTGILRDFGGIGLDGGLCLLFDLGAGVEAGGEGRELVGHVVEGVIGNRMRTASSCELILVGFGCRSRVIAAVWLILC